MKFGKKLAISSKKVFNSEFVHNKNCLKAKKINTEENFQCFYVTVILIDIEKIKTIIFKCF